MPIASNEVDLVMANMYLHHVEDPEAALKEMYRILKTGGQIVFTDLDKHDNYFLKEEQHDTWMGFERSDIEQWMRSCGFQKVEVDCVGADCCASSDNGENSAKVSIFIASGVK